MVVLGFVLFAGGGGDDAGPTPTATRDPRLGAGPVAQTVTVDADDEGQAANPTFSVTTITGNAGEIIEIDVNNIGSVAHNLAFAGLDGEYGSPDDWITTPQTIQPGESGKVLVKFNEPGTYPYRCDFHPLQQRGNLILN
jgi:plastocyanin